MRSSSCCVRPVCTCCGRSRLRTTPTFPPGPSGRARSFARKRTPSNFGGCVRMHGPCRLKCRSTPRSGQRSTQSYHRRVDHKLLELLVCPVTKGHLDFDRARQELISRSARLAYPIRDGIPILLEQEARTLSDDEIEKLPPRTPLV